MAATSDTVLEDRKAPMQGRVSGELALQWVQEREVVELDEQAKATMVSNPLAAICSEQATQQVVNAGSLYT